MPIEQQLDPSGGYESRGAAFTPYRSPRRVWQEFNAWWQRNRPNQPLPSLHGITALTGLPRTTVQRLQSAEPGHAEKPPG